MALALARRLALASALASALQLEVLELEVLELPSTPKLPSALVA